MGPAWRVLRARTALRICPSDGEDFLLAVEAQERRDDRKEQSWAYCVAYLQSKYKLPVLLLVVCRDRATAKWAAGPFDCGTRGWTVQRTCPLVVGPDNLPMITDVRSAAKHPAMAAFSALTHANSPECDAILDALDQALGDWLDRAGTVDHAEELFTAEAEGQE